MSIKADESGKITIELKLSVSLQDAATLIRASRLTVFAPQYVISIVTSSNFSTEMAMLINVQISSQVNFNKSCLNL